MLITISNRKHKDRSDIALVTDIYQSDLAPLRPHTVTSLVLELMVNGVHKVLVSNRCYNKNSEDDSVYITIKRNIMMCLTDNSEIINAFDYYVEAGVNSEGLVGYWEVKNIHYTIKLIA